MLFRLNSERELALGSGPEALHLLTLKDSPARTWGRANLRKQLGGKRNSVGSWKVLTQMAVSGHSSQTPEKLLFPCVTEAEVNCTTFSYVQTDPHLYLKLPGKKKSANCTHFGGPITALNNVSRTSHLRNTHWGFC